MSGLFGNRLIMGNMSAINTALPRMRAGRRLKMKSRARARSFQHQYANKHDKVQRDEKVNRRREYLEKLFLKFGDDFHATHS